MVSKLNLAIFGLFSEILHCSFVLQCTEMAATSKGLEPPSDIRVKKEVREHKVMLHQIKCFEEIYTNIRLLKRGSIGFKSL